MEVFMKFSNRLLIVFLATITFQSTSILYGHPTSAPGNSAEIILEDDLHTALTSKKPTVIMAYMDHCPYCKALTPFFDKMSIKYRNVSFLTVHGPKFLLHKKVADLSNNTFKIPGYPSVLLIKNGKIKDIHIGGNTKALEDKIKGFLKAA